VIPSDAWNDSCGRKEAKESAKESWNNYWHMVNNGVPKEKLIYVFHMNEPLYWLEKVIKSEIPYIGLSPNTKSDFHNKKNWLDRVMNVACDNEGYPRAKYHGFGVSSLPLILQYPWFSVDSTYWIYRGRYGEVIMPRPDRNKWIYDKNSWIISFTPHTPSGASRHYDKLTPNKKKVVDTYLEQCGYKVGRSVHKRVTSTYKLKKNELWIKKGKKVDVPLVWGLSNDYAQRLELNAMYFMELEKRITPWPWPYKKRKKKFFL